MSHRTKAFVGAVALACLALGGCEKATVELPGGDRLTLMGPANQSVMRGATEKVAIMIVRRGFDDPVKIEVDDLPKGVHVEGGKHVTIPTGALKIDVKLVADPDAPLITDQLARVTATGPGHGEVVEHFKVSVVPEK